MSEREASGAFERITVNGERLSRGQLIDRLEAQLEKEKEQEAWLRPAIDTLLNLGRGHGLPATTSGTTGPPKSMVIPPQDLIASARLTGRAFGLKPGDRVLHCLPSDFVAGKLVWVRGFVLDLDLCLVDPRGSVFDHIAPEDHFAFAAMVPLQLHRALLEDPARVGKQFGTILLGGGPVSDELIEHMEGLDTVVSIGYGSTETVTHVALRQLNRAQRDPNFTAIGDCSFGRDPRGCLVVYTPHLRTSQHVTNDIVELIDDTHFNWLGRHDNVILSGGKKIFPEQLEAKTAGVIPYPHYFSGVSDAALGQAVVLTVETAKPGSQVLPEIMDLIMPVLHPHEWPRRVIALERIERTSSGKMKRG